MQIKPYVGRNEMTDGEKYCSSVPSDHLVHLVNRGMSVR